jgi:hypothetical protein
MNNQLNVVSAWSQKKENLTNKCVCQHIIKKTNNQFFFPTHSHKKSEFHCAEACGAGGGAGCGAGGGGAYRKLIK